jgi:hypothetical protein
MKQGCNGDDVSDCLYFQRSHCNVFAIVIQKPFLSINSLLSVYPKGQTTPCTRADAGCILCDVADTQNMTEVHHQISLLLSQRDKHERDPFTPLIHQCTPLLSSLTGNRQFSFHKEQFVRGKHSKVGKDCRAPRVPTRRFLPRLVFG